MTLSFQPLIDWIGSIFNKYLSDLSLKFVAYKTMIYTFITVTLPAVLKNLLTWLFGILTAQVDQFDWGSMSSTVIEFTGLAAWFAVHLRFVDCLSVLITALVIRLTLNFIPFVG
ncbi:MAG: hypothetical protein D3906_00535 [Candidatus Electrothrix sp. AUS1_2]|nr:hypothetical protein [Candidatus Electrothrix sp. AUS1_2]